jgi:hypothetical protein
MSPGAENSMKHLRQSTILENGGAWACPDKTDIGTRRRPGWSENKMGENHAR